MIKRPALIKSVSWEKDRWFAFSVRGPYVEKHGFSREDAANKVRRILEEYRKIDLRHAIGPDCPRLVGERLCREKEFTSRVMYHEDVQFD